jgi:hypothetical protein
VIRKEEETGGRREERNELCPSLIATQTSSPLDQLLFISTTAAVKAQTLGFAARMTFEEQNRTGRSGVEWGRSYYKKLMPGGENAPRGEISIAVKLQLSSLIFDRRKYSLKSNSFGY